MRRFAYTTLCIPTLLFAASLHAQTLYWSTSSCNGDESNTKGGWGWSQQEHVCELRRIVLPLKDGHIQVSGTNGGIHVIGEDRNDIELTVLVTAYASSKDKAAQIESQVKILTDGTIHDEGPLSSGWFFHSGYSVDYWLHVPQHISTELQTENGGIDIQNAVGTLHAETTNGGLILKDVSGDVHAHTVNGGIKINLSGDSWQGAGLSAQSVNGGIFVTVPDHYSAHLVSQTVNGGITVHFPITVQGDLRNHLDTNLGQGGSTIHLETVNGGISISK